MNIAFISISYSENNHISFYEELLQEFINNGHSVYVVCATEARKGKDTSISKLRGINVLRVKTGNITENKNLIEKGLSTLLIDHQFKAAIEEYLSDVALDLIIYPTPPITLAGVVKYLKNKHKASSYLLLKDIFPQNAIDLGMLSESGIKGFIYKYFRWKEKQLYAVSDYIGCMSPANVQYVLAHNKEVDENIIEVCPNSVKPIELHNNEEDKVNIRKKYGVPLDKKVFVYGGNLGKPQGIDFFLKCILAVKDVKEAFFLVVGGGSEAAKISKLIADNNIENAKLINQLPKDEYELLANTCDVGLVFLDYRFTIPNFPSRILSYMQNAMPVLVVTDPNTDMGDIAEANDFGWKCLSNDVEAFKTKVTEIIKSDLVTKGRNSRKYMLDNYDVKDSYKIIMKHFGKSEK